MQQSGIGGLHNTTAFSRPSLVAQCHGLPLFVFTVQRFSFLGLLNSTIFLYCFAYCTFVLALLVYCNCLPSFVVVFIFGYSCPYGMFLSQRNPSVCHEYIDLRKLYRVVINYDVTNYYDFG